MSTTAHHYSTAVALVVALLWTLVPSAHALPQGTALVAQLPATPPPPQEKIPSAKRALDPDSEASILWRLVKTKGALNSLDSFGRPPLYSELYRLRTPIWVPSCCFSHY